MKYLYKAKALHGNSNSWLYGYYCRSENGEDMLVSGNASHVTCTMIDPKTLCRYIGDKDSKGKDLWEYDFVRYNGRMYQILWSQGNLAYILAGDNDYIYLNDRIMPYLEKLEE